MAKVTWTTSSTSGVDSEDSLMDLTSGDVLPDIQETVSYFGNRPRSLLVEQSPEGNQNDEAPEVIDARAYQLEMFEKSLKQNVIVAMDTGSGKTQVAILRIMAELENCGPDRIVWFLAPTVLLCGQQHDVIKSQIPSAPIKLLTGNDNVDAWSGRLWESVLKGTRIVVSTPQVLYDALCHGFVKVEMLALLIFDEAHNCVGKNSGGKIMTHFYHQRIGNGESVPSILGLTASPSISSKLEDIERLEKTLDARCVTPTIHRRELLKCVKRPKIYHIEYHPESASTAAMASLSHAYSSMNIAEDPYILKLVADPTDRNRRELGKVFMKHNTFSQKQMKGLVIRSNDISRELGTWAVDRYISRAVTECHDKIQSGHDYFEKWMADERRYLADTLRKVAIVPPPSRPESPKDISSKVNLLIKELLSADKSPLGIVFVRERATVSMLHDLLTAFPQVLERYRIGAVVGTSSFQTTKRNVYEFLTNIDLLVLQKFRSGQINLLIATSVLEEGIDVPACNLVVCFDEPPTFKSFIQRRGRSRMRDSKLVLLLEKSARATKQWEKMEEEMKRQYQDEEREWQRLEMLENVEESSSTCFIVPSTGARLDFDNAKQYLDHFCSKLSRSEFVSARPDYIVESNWDKCGRKMTARVLLPPFLPQKVRCAESKYSWASEKNATKDAAFHAFLALYDAGLVNDHLNPFEPEQLAPGVETRASIADVEPAFTPWKQIAHAWEAETDRFVYTLTCFNENGTAMGEYDIMLPVELNQTRPIRIYLDHNVVWELQYSLAKRVGDEEASKMPNHTTALLTHNFGHRWQVEDRPHVIRVIAKGAGTIPDKASAPTLENIEEQIRSQRFLLRDKQGIPFLYHELLPSKPPIEQVQSKFYEYSDAPEDVPYVSLRKWTKRSDFLHPLISSPEGTSCSKPYQAVLPLPWVNIDAMPVEHVRFAMLLPSVLHEVEVTLTAQDLANTLLKPLDFTNLDLIREAISSRSAAEPLHYERLEFLGDSILKYCASIIAAFMHPEWPEGYLSLFKDRLVSNSRLSRAAIEKGLSKYILTKAFTGLKWRPIYLDDVLEEDISAKVRQLSTKTLADVVEALIGASYQDGGIKKATKCISLFVDNQEWPDVSVAHATLYEIQPDDAGQLAEATLLEELIGYSFQKKSLLCEAMTHASYVTAQRSMERLEFIGDAVLDKIIVTRLFAVEPPLHNYQMHLLLTAMVNGDFLAFVCLEYGAHLDESIVTEEGIVTKEGAPRIWKFMRHASATIGTEQIEMAIRHQELRGSILNAMETSTHYPWALLARLKAKKFYSDLMEALLGAVWIDSGSLETCTSVIERLGIFKYLERILRDGVQVQHPKEVIGMLAIAETVKYEVLVDKDNEEGGHSCTLSVGDRVVTRVDGGLSKEEIKTKAATEAVRILESELENTKINC